MSGFLEASEAAYWRSQWNLAPGVTYLNHGSFGPPPRPVQAARRAWQEQMDAQPMDFFFRRLEPAWFQSRRRLAGMLGADEGNLVFAENATAAMNVLAHSLRLRPGDEVLLTDHEYGAVQRIWRRAAESVEGAAMRTAQLPLPIEAADQVVEAIFTAATERTRLLIVSHITSPTAVTLPVEPIVAEAKRRGILVCIDGPHAVAQLPLDLDRLGCDFYCASCHKWLSAPFGSGFLYVAPQHQALIRTPVLSWGRLPPTRLETWSDEFVWSGTRDPSPYLAIPAAIDFLEQVGLDRFRQHTHALAQYARQRLVELTGQTPIFPDSPDWYGCMAHVPLPPGDAAALQRQLWADDGIEVPIISWNDRRWIRVSCHLYNTRQEIDRLVEAVRRGMRDERYQDSLTKGTNMQACDMPSRREFFKLAGVAGSALAVGSVLGRPGFAAEEGPQAEKKKAPFSLGLASYTLRKFDLDQTLAMTKRVGLTHICLKSFHLPLDATAEQIAAVVAKIKEAGLDLYGCGVVTMKTDKDVNQAFDYAKAAGMRTIVGAPIPDVLPLVNEKVKQFDIEVAIHNHGPGDKVYPTPESIYQKVEKLDKRIGLCIDIGHTARIGADPIADAERFADRLLDLHVKDVSAAKPEGKTVECGRGVIDLPAFLRTLLKINYSRVASFEHEKDENDPLAGLAESVGYIRGALAGIG